MIKMRKIYRRNNLYRYINFIQSSNHFFFFFIKMSLRKLKDALSKRKSDTFKAQMEEQKRSMSVQSVLETNEYTMPSPTVLNRRSSLDSLLELENSEEIMEDSEILKRLFPLDLSLEDFSSILMNLFDKKINEKAVEFSEKKIHQKMYKNCFSSKEFIDCIIEIEKFPKKNEKSTKIKREFGKLFGERKKKKKNNS